MIFFTDGSFTQNEGCGSAAVCEDKVETASIGSLSTVSNDEAELVAIGLAIRAFKQYQRLNPSLCTLSIFSDSQSAIQALHNPIKCRSNQYIVNTLKTLISHAPLPTNLKLFWVPGHEGIELNELSDSKAREAALKETEDIKLNMNFSALKRAIKSELKPKPNCFTTNKPFLFKTPAKKIWDTLAKLEKGRASIIFQLQSGHIALNAYLYKLYNNTVILSPNCENCQVPETVDHFLIHCKRFHKQRTTLRQAIKKEGIKVNPYVSSKLIDQPDVFFLLSNYVLNTNCFSNFKIFIDGPDN